MTGWLIFAGIMAVLLLLLFSPARLRLAYLEDRLTIKASYLFLMFDLSPEKLEQVLSAKTESKVVPEPGADGEKEAAKRKKERSVFELITDLLRSSEGMRRILKRHIVLDRVKIYAAICGEDAHKTALSYASLSGGAYSLLAAAGLLCTLKEPDVRISPDFTGEKSHFEIAFRLSVCPWFVLAALLNFAFKFLLLQIKTKPRKGGIKHEPTTSCQ